MPQKRLSLRAVFDHIPAGILVWDTEQRLLTANKRAEGILKKDLRKFRGQTIKEIVRDREGFMEAVTAVSHAEKPVTRRSMVINLEGDPRTIGYSGGPVSEGLSFVLLFQDISAFVSV